MGKKKEFKKKKDLHLRFFIIFGCFLIETAIVITLLLLPVFFSYSYLYALIPLLVLVFLNFFLGIFIINTKVEPIFKQSWLACCLIFPYIGSIVYLLFGHKMTTKRYLKGKNNVLKEHLNKYKHDDSEVFKRIGEVNKDALGITYYLSSIGYEAYNDTRFTYFPSGEEGFKDILEELKKAKRYIFIEFFIIERGKMYDSIYEILKQKVKEGVKVYFVYDDFGTSTKIPKKHYKQVRKDGIKCFRFNKIAPTMNIRQNIRDHRKIIVIDGLVGYTGGCNLADEYINEIVRFGYWKDNFLKVEGKACDTLIKTFTVFYFIASHEELPLEEYFYDNNKDLLLGREIKNNDSFVIPYTDVPYDIEAISRNIYLDMINKAKDYVYLSTPYLIPDNETMTALCNASKRGVKVKIITPGIPDKKIVYQVTKSYYSELMIAGCEIYEYTPGFNHEKTMVVDDKIALSGTCNFDCRSFYLNFEDGILIINDKEILKMRDSLSNMISESKKQEIEKYVNCSIFRRWMWSILRIFSSLL